MVDLTNILLAQLKSTSNPKINRQKYMCLTLKKNPSLIKPTKATTVYRVYGYEIENGQMMIKSPIRKTKPVALKTAMTIVSDRKSRWITRTELASSQVLKGLHAYTALTKAKARLTDCNTKAVVVEMTGLPENHVATGRDGDIVFTELTFNKVVLIKPYGFNSKPFQAKGTLDRYLNAPLRVKM